MPLALLPDIYKTSTLARADPKLRPGDQSILLLCQALQGMAELGTSEDGVTPNWRYGDLSQMACYVLQGLKHHTEVTNTMVSAFFQSDPLIGHAQGVLRAAIKTYEEVEKVSVANDSMGTVARTQTQALQSQSLPKACVQMTLKILLISFVWM